MSLPFPLNELVGQEVTQVCIGLAQVQIHLCRQPQSGPPDTWDAGARIDVESAYTLDEGATHVSRVEPRMFKLAAAPLTRLLGETVTEAHAGQRNELRLRFSNGLALRLHTDPQGLDAFHVHAMGKSITVTSP